MAAATKQDIASYAIVKLNNNSYITVKPEIIPQPASAQLAEIVVINESFGIAGRGNRKHHHRLLI